MESVKTLVVLLCGITVLIQRQCVAEQGVRFFSSVRRMDDKSVGMLEAMARRDPNYELLMDDFVQQSFDFLGDLHKGGELASTIRIAIPFWQWYAHMLKLTFITMPLKYPKRALFMQMLGEIGRDYQERMGVTVPYGESFVPFIRMLLIRLMVSSRLLVA
jgi:hypothetical protein